MIETCFIYNGNIGMDVSEEVVEIASRLLIRWHHLRRYSHGVVRAEMRRKLDLKFFLSRSFSEALLLVDYVRRYFFQVSNIQRVVNSITHQLPYDRF